MEEENPKVKVIFLSIYNETPDYIEMYKSQVKYLNHLKQHTHNPIPKYYFITCKELGNKTLVSKGTLTGVLERLEGKGYVSRESNPEDARSQLISLTKSGQKLFERVFPAHMEFLGKAFTKLSATELAELRMSLAALKAIFKLKSHE